jgi:hypothetical protein
MTTIKELSIPQTQLKLRWREPYVTDGTNKALAVLDPGAYRGGYVRETDPISTSFRITAEGEQDNHFLWVDKTSGAALSIRYGTDVLVDMSDLFTGPGGTLPSAQTWYVWIDCVYTVGGPTSGKFYVGDAAPSSANAVRLARISMPNGATAILDSYINISTTYRTVAHVDRPILLARRVSKAVSTNKFQLTGKVFFPAGTASLAQRELGIQLSETSGLTRFAYTGDDGGAIWVKQVWADSGLSVAITSDSEGFILDPWVELDLSQTADPTPPSCWVRYWTRGTLRDLVLSDEIVADWVPHEHAAYVATREKAGYPTPLIKGSVQSQIETLLTAVNERISALAPESAPAAPVLLWRSHNVASDALVTGTTISIYWGTNLGFAVIVGGYISGSNAVRALVAPGDTMVLLRLHGNIGAGPELLSSPAAAGATVAWNNAALWSAGLYTTDFFGVPLFTMPALLVQLLSVTLGLTLDSAPMLLSNHDSYIAGNQPGTGGLNAYCRLFESAGTDAKMRLYYGDHSFWLTFNAEWVPGSPSKWYEDDNTRDAMAIGLYLTSDDPVFGIRKKFKANFGSGWITADWDSVFRQGMQPPSALVPGYATRTFVPMVAVGKYVDVCRWLVSIPPYPEPHPPLMSGIGYTTVNYHAYLTTTPNFTVIEDPPEGSSGTWVVNPMVILADEIGAYISGGAEFDDLISSTAYGRLWIYNAT